MTTVYRIETPNGHGICAALGSPLCQAYRVSGGKEVEHCHFDKAGWRKLGKLCRDHDMVFAFPTLEALKTWFPSQHGRKVMRDMGARVVPYEVDHLEIASPYQCVFNKAEAVAKPALDLAILT